MRQNTFHILGGVNLKALINVCIYDFHFFKYNSYVLFDDTIEETGSMEDFRGADEVFDCRNMVVMPGLTNCHTHIYSTFSRGLNLPFNPENFTDILKQLWWKIDSQLDSEAVYLSALVYGGDLIRSGVTSIIDHHASGLIIRGSLDRLRQAICCELGLRGIFCFETSDRFDVHECIEENTSFCSKKDQHSAGLFGMHASLSLSDDTLSRIASSINDLPIHIHAAESSDDENDSIERYGMGVVQRLDSFGLLHRNSILAHCVHIKESEAELISGRGCFTVLNPTSNMNNAVGLANYENFKKHNVKCMVGNDGLGANITRDYQNMVFAMKNRLGGTTKFNIDDLLVMIDNGYEYISNALNIKIGRIERGYKADMITVPYQNPTPMGDYNMAGHLFFGMFDNFHPRDVWVSGKCLMKGYKVAYDMDSVYEKARVESDKVWKRIESLDGRVN